MKTIITTVGTSLFTHHLASEVLGDLKKTYQKVQHLSFKGDWHRFDSQPTWQALENAYRESNVSLTKISAEVASLDKIMDEWNAEEQEEDFFNIVLLATDTVASVLAARIIAFFFEAEGRYTKHHVAIEFTPSGVEDGGEVITGFQMKDMEDFRQEGLPNLQAYLHKPELLGPDLSKGSDTSNIRFNLTGGYKVMAMLLRDIARDAGMVSYYMFQEESNVDEYKPQMITLSPGEDFAQAIS